MHIFRAKQHTIFNYESIERRRMLSENQIFAKKDYFEIRCNTIVKYKNILWKNGLFDLVVGDIFTLAEKYNYLEQVKKLLADKLK